MDVKHIRDDQTAVEVLLGNLLRKDPVLMSRLAIGLENTKARSPGYYCLKRVQDIAEEQLRKETEEGRDISPAGMAKRLRELEDRMDGTVTASDPREGFPTGT